VGTPAATALIAFLLSVLLLDEGCINSKGRIAVYSLPTGFTVWLDAESTGRTTNCVLDGVHPGMHRVQLRGTGYLDWDSTVSVSAGQTTNILGEPLTATGRIAVYSIPDSAAVWLDGVATGETTSCVLYSVAPGVHTIMLAQPTRLHWDTTLTISPGKAATVSPLLFPYQVGCDSASSSESNVSVVGDYAYLSGGFGSGYWQVVDISDPCHPKTLDSTIPTLFGSAVKGHYLFACQSSGLVVFDISDPSSPRMVANLDTLGCIGSATDIAVVGQFAYLTGRWWPPYPSDTLVNGLLVMDISDPANPTKETTLMTGADEPYNMARDSASTQLLCVASDTWLRVYDVSNPQSPQELGDCAIALGGNRVVVSAPYAYLAGWTGLQVVDLSDPSAPRVVGSNETFHLWSPAVQGSYVYAIGNDGLPTFYIINVSNPTNPLIEAAAYSAYPDGPLGVAVQNQYAYVTTGSPEGLAVFKLRN
jgi:hypothetical protein